MESTRKGCKNYTKEMSRVMVWVELNGLGVMKLAIV
jgi:hypothetical protein